MSATFEIVRPAAVTLTVQSSGATLEREESDAALVVAPVITVQSGVGDGGGSTVTAAEPIGGHRVVTAAGLHANPADADLVIGVSRSASAVGVAIDLVAIGPLTEASWSWTPGAALFIGAVGVLTQVPPTAGKSRVIARAITATTINVDPQPTILLT